MKLHHIIEAQQFDVPTLDNLFEIAKKMETVVKQGGTSDYHSRIMSTLFWRSVLMVKDEMDIS